MIVHLYITKFHVRNMKHMTHCVLLSKTYSELSSLIIIFYRYRGARYAFVQKCLLSEFINQVEDIQWKVPFNSRNG